MKKNELILSAVAAVVMTGCGGGSSSSGTTTSLPTFATQEAEITSTESVQSVANTVSTVTTQFGNQTPTTKSTERTSFTDKVMASKVDKRLKTFGMRTKEKLASLAKKTMATAVCEPIEEVYEEGECTESGTFSVLYTQALNAEGQCVQTYTETALNCHDIGSFSPYEGVTVSWDDTYSGTLVMTETLVFDNQQSPHLVAEGYEDTFKGTGTETYEETGLDPVTYSYQEDIDLANTYRMEYTLIEGVFTSAEKFSAEENGRLNMSYSINGQNEATFALLVDMMGSYDESQAEKLAITLDGYIDLKYTFGTESEQSFGLAAEALNMGYDWSVSGTTTSTIDGKIGSYCTGGMIDVNTSTPIEDNYADAFELPNKGLMNLTGAAGTTASLEYYEDNTGTHAVATVGEETKTYDTYAELEGEACQGEFINPLENDM